MKILQITAVDFTLKKFLLPLIDSLQLEGYEVHTACNCSYYSQELKQQGYVLHHIPFARNFNLISHLKSLVWLIKLFKNEKYDCIHTHTPVASIIARIAAKIAGVRVIIYTAHGFYFHENMNRFVYNITYLLEKLCGKFFSDYIFFQSQEDYELAVKNKFNQHSRLIHIGNGVSSDIFNPQLFDKESLRENMGFKSSDLLFIFVGRLVKEKGIQELINAFDKILKTNKNVKLLLVGGSVAGDRDKLDVQELIMQTREETRRNIYFLGLRNDIPQLLLMSDIFVLPSYREGLPRSIIEAMAMEKPIIATDIRGCREEVKDSYNGYLCKPRDTEGLAEKMLLMVTNFGSIKTLGENSRRLFIDQFDEKVVLKKQTEIFKKISEVML